MGSQYWGGLIDWLKNRMLAEAKILPGYGFNPGR